MAKWRKQCLSQALMRCARRFPGQEALVIDRRRLTYAQLWDSVKPVAAGLRGLGVERGDHVAVCMGNSPEWVQFFYGAAAIGAVTVPVNTRFKADELKYCLRQSDARLLFISDRFLNIDFVEMLRSICPGVDRRLPHRELPALEQVVVLGADVPKAAVSWETFCALGDTGPAFKLPEVAPDDVLLIQYTSGTTSYPKGVMLTHDNMLRNAACVVERFGLGAGDRYYSARVFYHVAGTTLSLLAALVSGACLLSTAHFEPGEALRMMSEEGCTHTSGNDTMFLMMLNHPELGRYPLKLKGGWASAGPEVSRKVVEHLGMKGLCQAYGLSETSPNVCMSRHDDDLEKRIGGWAHILDGVKVRIANPETGKRAPPGESGEILVRGWSLMKGYYKMPEQTAMTIDARGWLHTGDLGVMDGDGRLRFIARIKDIIRVGGENVAPPEVEEVLHQHPAVKQAQVIGVPDARLVEVPAAYLILKAGAVATPDEIVAWSRARMANFRVPRYVKIVDSFDSIGMTGSAKVQKNKLRAQALIDFGLEDRKPGQIAAA
ncbi:MAG TPA: AMP-binding protein [Burkholderiales bacterium]|nr:AMP-binding protein [Burkholderiales bacterium]